MSFNSFFLFIKKKEKLKEKTQQIIKNKPTKTFQKINFIIKMAISIIFSYSNNFLNVKKNNQNYIYSMKNNSKLKTSNSQILKHFYKIILTKLKLSKNMLLTTVLNFFNNKHSYQWFIKKLSNYLFIPIVRFFKKISYNGCRKKKLKRKG